MLSAYQSLGARVLMFSLPSDVMSDVLTVAEQLGMTTQDYIVNDDDETVKNTIRDPVTEFNNPFYRYRIQCKLLLMAPCRVLLLTFLCQWRG